LPGVHELLMSALEHASGDDMNASRMLYVDDEPDIREIVDMSLGLPVLDALGGGGTQMDVARALDRLVTSLERAWMKPLVAAVA
jgi:hypothetical protein